MVYIFNYYCHNCNEIISLQIVKGTTLRDFEEKNRKIMKCKNCGCFVFAQK